MPEIAGNRDIAGVRTLQELTDVDFAIARAAFAVAETGLCCSATRNST